MFQKLRFENIIKNKVATGVEIILLPDGAYEINVVTLKRNKSEVVIESKLSDIKDIPALSNVIDKKSPIILVINGKGIIHRKVSLSESDSLSAVLNKILPNANINEFYIQKQNANDAPAFVSVVRALVLDDLIAELKNNMIANIAQCYVGPFVISTVLGLIDKRIISNEFLAIGNFKLQIREDKINDVLISNERSKEIIKIGDDLLEEKFVIPFSAALSYFVGGEEGILNAETIDSVKENFKQKQKFQTIGWSLLIVAFLILMLNYFAFNHYWQKSNEMNSELELNQSALKKYETLKAEYSQKKIFLEQNGLLENSRTSLYADKLAGSLPSSIQLLEMDIHPLKKKEASDISNALYFDNKIIKISGKCNRNTELNDWMTLLKKTTWIEDVSLLNYKQDNAKDDGVFYLEIKIK